MKENETWLSIITALKTANEAGGWAFWRERFNTAHPNHKTDEVDNPAQFAWANWVAAKHVYLINKEEMDVYARAMRDGEITSYPGKTQDCEFFFAMKRVVEEEVESQFEEQILKEETMERDEELVLSPIEKLDEDEQYVKETAGRFDGDDYVSDDDEDDFLSEGAFGDDDTDGYGVDWGLDDEE